MWWEKRKKTLESSINSLWCSRWYLVTKCKWDHCNLQIYNFPVKKPANSKILSPLHSVSSTEFTKKNIFMGKGTAALTLVKPLQAVISLNSIYPWENKTSTTRTLPTFSNSLNFFSSHSVTPWQLAFFTWDRIKIFRLSSNLKPNHNKKQNTTAETGRKKKCRSMCKRHTY